MVRLGDPPLEAKKNSLNLEKRVLEKRASRGRDAWTSRTRPGLAPPTDRCLGYLSHTLKQFHSQLEKQPPGREATAWKEPGRRASVGLTRPSTTNGEMRATAHRQLPIPDPQKPASPNSARRLPLKTGSKGAPGPTGPLITTRERRTNHAYDNP